MPPRLALVGQAPGEPIGPRELAALTVLDARDAGVADLAGLERAVNLEGLDLGLNPLVDLRVLELPPGDRPNWAGRVVEVPLTSVAPDDPNSDAPSAREMSFVRLALRVVPVGDVLTAPDLLGSGSDRGRIGQPLIE